MNQTPNDAERQMVTVTIAGRQIQVEKVGIRLPFARKPVDLRDMTAIGTYEVYVSKTVTLTLEAFDEFASRLLTPRDWLAGEGGNLGHARVCVEVVAAGRPTLFVDPSGADYGRYVAKLG